ncbi:hypothetical protein IQ07DRAFT_643562 [Pyrenochaeta sp. DS3sAY3a]|nr:hypothetical protein IQ07DRAFT_643562 [Pyrenochaeta sp. DS3sAY3a]
MDFPHPTLGNDVPRVCTLQTAKDFLGKNYVSCHQTNEDCRTMISYLPRRVVDITGPEYELIEPPSGTVGSYAIVSYACGDGKFLTTNTSTIGEPRRCFNQNMVPDAIRDAAMLARSVQIQYLWIDTLCIVQDNPTERDHAAKIGEIFQGAALTIAASAAPDLSTSLFVSRTSSYQDIDLFHEGTGIWKNTIFKARRKISCGNHAKTGKMVNLDCDALDTRASALQERLLSRRLISFTGAEIQWKCRAVQACECRKKPYPGPAPFSVPAPSPGLNLLLLWSESWNQIIEEYSARKVETRQDRLQEICGMREIYGAMTGFTYIDGLWKETLLYYLSWQRDGDVSFERRTSDNPTFSWASLAGAVNFRFARYSDRVTRRPHAELVDTKRITVGRLDSRSSITVRGYTVDATLRVSNDDLQPLKLCVGGADFSSNANQEVPCEFSIDILGEGERDVVLLSLYSISYHNSLHEVFLILGKSRVDSKIHRRIGIGSGKFCNRGRNNVDFSSELHDPIAFDWLADDLARSSSEFGGMSQRLITIW